jgi:energy-coupling factor transport system ATP-binding protein
MANLESDIIRAEELTFEYLTEDGGGLHHGGRAIDGVTFSVQKGSFTAIIGSNGSGKSTLAKNMNALLFPTGGKLYVDGHDTTVEEFLWEIRRCAAMVFQNPDNQLVSTIVEDDVAFGPENLGITPGKIRDRVDDALRAVGMYEFRKKAPHMLSGGQKQRIAIAGAIAMHPDVIIMDEPTAMLDPKGRRAVLEIAHTLNRRGMTIILITHFMEEAASADRVIIMEKGKIAMDGTPSEVFSDVERLREMSLDIPVAVDIAKRMRDAGIDVPKEIVTEEALSDFIAGKYDKG